MLRGMWDLPGPGLEPVSPALAGGFLTTASPGKPLVTVLCLVPGNRFCPQEVSGPGERGGGNGGRVLLGTVPGRESGGQWETMNWDVVTTEVLGNPLGCSGAGPSELS